MIFRRSFFPALALAAGCFLSACSEDAPAEAPAAQAQDQARAQAARIPPQDFPPGTVAETPPPAGVTLVNDPSAPADTPLCGTAAREANAISATNYPQPLSTGNSCTANACFDPSTVTYIASDGTRRVCR
ncbi:hypothetical protein LOC54_00450 [Acetobacter sp. AN02]|uniref:hypothetical protein n=1 Tax=Acetobacter sp. AN02 TaxID=2894186 RepID=UPI0024341EC8|nr:hypothetical protein [Acetobacter sp. AN02]MDG6093594.1 hypothetical protein [Acetobacter sp. AN02]